MNRRRLALVLLALVTASLLTLPAHPAAADEGWIIRSFDVTYTINADASVDVVEDIRLDFLNLRKHGIYRTIPVEYQIEGDPKHHRLITLSNVKIDNGEGQNYKWSRQRVGYDEEFKIGDPDKTISGPQRYRISYRVTGAFNSFESHDEFYWNVTGESWPVRMEGASASLVAPALTEVICYQGYLGSNTTCNFSLTGNSARFATKGSLAIGQGLTIVAALPKGAVTVPPPQLKYIKSPKEAIVDFMGLKPLPIIGAVLLGIGGIGAVVRNWWINGRDLWAGDVHYLTGSDDVHRRPMFARETVVVEYTPPEIGRERRPLRPAEIGVLLDERADTLDVSATIVDLAVRKYLRIEQIEGKGLFGKDDYRLHRLRDADAELLDYERRLFDELFDGKDSVLMSSLRNAFYKDLETVKKMLYTQSTSKNKFFPSSPESVRTKYVVAGFVIAGAGGALAIFLGSLEIGAILGLPVLVAGLLLAILARAMPHRTAAGRETYRRALGFREYMEVAETDRQRFYEDASIFDKYLPYAIVYGCTEKWARAFEGLEGMEQATHDWYTGTRPFTPVLFANTINSFSNTVSSNISSVPASSGSSGFSGGGGGGFGGGGGRSW